MFEFLRHAGRRPIARLAESHRSDPAFLPAPRAQTPEETVRITASVMDRRKPPARAVNVRFLDAAKTGRLESTWTTNPSTADAIILKDWRAVVARSRDAAENNDHARKYLSLVRENVAGPNGFRFKSTCFDPPTRPGGNTVPDYAAQDAIDAAFRIFSAKGAFDVTGLLSRRAFERLWVTSKATNGEALAMFVYGESAGPYGFAVQMLDPLCLDVRHNEDLPNGNIIRHGIEMTPHCRPIAYHLRQIDSLWGGATTVTSQSVRRVPAELIIHDFLPEMVGQKRGLGSMRSVLPRLRNVKGFEDASVINARVGAAKMGFFRNMDAADGEDVDADELPMDAEPAVLENIGNRELISWNPQFPNGDFEPFLRGCLRSVASGLTVSYNNLANDLTAVSYSSIRQGALDEREVWKGWQEDTIENLAFPIFTKWLEYALLAQKIRINGLPLKPERIEKYREASFNGRRWSWVDPLKEIAAAERAVALGIKSRQAIIRETSVDDPYRILDELEEEKKEMERRGIYTPPQGAGAPATASPNSTPANNAPAQATPDDQGDDGE